MTRAQPLHSRINRNESGIIFRCSGPENRSTPSRIASQKGLFVFPLRQLDHAIENRVMEQLTSCRHENWSRASRIAFRSSHSGDCCYRHFKFASKLMIQEIKVPRTWDFLQSRQLQNEAIEAPGRENLNVVMPWLGWLG